MNRSSVIYFVLGATAGATIALLTAPRSGAETRRQLKQAKDRLADRAVRVGTAIGEAYRSAIEAGSDGFVRTSSRMPARIPESSPAPHH